VTDLFPGESLVEFWVIKVGTDGLSLNDTKAENRSRALLMQHIIPKPQNEADNEKNI